jgi:hypothetical protein
MGKCHIILAFAQVEAILTRLHPTMLRNKCRVPICRLSILADDQTTWYPSAREDAAPGAHSLRSTALDLPCECSLQVARIGLQA